MRMQMKRLGWKLHSFPRRRFHDFAVTVAGKTVGTRHQLQRARTAMFLMTSRAGAVLHHVGFVECVCPALLRQVAGLTFSIDWLERDSVAETFAQHCLE